MDLELKPSEAYVYTLNELEKNLALAELHLKQFSEKTKYFCLDCLRKHLIIIEGLAEEGINFTEDETEKKKFSKIAEFVKLVKPKLSSIDEAVAFDLADKLRIIRKSLCKVCSEPEAKALNTEKQNNIRGIKMEMRQIGWVTGSQFLARGVQEAEAYFPGEVVSGVKTKTAINIVGGIGAVLAALWRGTPETFKLPLVVIGSKLLVDEIVDLAKTTTAAPAFVPRFAPTAAPVAAPAYAQGLVKVD
jgi:hypothetical protein